MSYSTIKCTKNYIKNFKCPNCHKNEVFIDMDNHSWCDYTMLKTGQEYYCDNCHIVFKIKDSNKYMIPKHSKKYQLRRTRIEMLNDVLKKEYFIIVPDGWQYEPEKRIKGMYKGYNTVKEMLYNLEGIRDCETMPMLFFVDGMLVPEVVNAPSLYEYYADEYKGEDYGI